MQSSCQANSFFAILPVEKLLELCACARTSSFPVSSVSTIRTCVSVVPLRQTTCKFNDTTDFINVRFVSTYVVVTPVVVIFYRLRNALYPPSPNHCDEFCEIQRQKQRSCSHGMWACPNCRNIYDGNAQCCSGYMDISDSSGSSSIESINGDSQSGRGQRFRFRS